MLEEVLRNIAGDGKGKVNRGGVWQFVNKFRCKFCCKSVGGGKVLFGMCGVFSVVVMINKQETI